jgi:uncharacterized membrane protein YcaP (DUF421 family)
MGAMSISPDFWSALWPGAGPLLTDLLQPGIPILSKLIRPIVVYAFLLAALRLAGRRELAQLNVFDLVVLLTLSNTVQNAGIGNDNSLLGGLFGAAVLLVTNYVVVRLLYLRPHLLARVQGPATELVRHGRVLQDNLRRELITPEELVAAVHRQGVEKIGDVQHAVLESTGTITVIPRDPHPHDVRTVAILDRLDRLTTELHALRTAVEARS